MLVWSQGGQTVWVDKDGIIFPSRGQNPNVIPIMVDDSTGALPPGTRIPVNVIQIEDFIKVGINGVSIGSNDLTMLTQGTDRDNSEVAPEFNERNPAVLWALEKVIKTAGKLGITSSICGQAASYPEILDVAIKAGVTSLSVNIDTIDKIRQEVYEFTNVSRVCALP